MRKNAKIFKIYENTNKIFLGYFFMVIFGYLGLSLSLGIYQKPNPKQNE
jgi:hypothetical protein